LRISSDYDPTSDHWSTFCSLGPFERRETKFGCLGQQITRQTGSKLGLLGPKRGHKFGCNTLNSKPGSDLGYGPQNGVRIGSFTLKLDLLTAFGYMGFSVEGLLSIEAFGYRGFWVYRLFGTQAPFWTHILDPILDPQNGHLPDAGYAQNCAGSPQIC
jgi:hypothetical protein